MNLDLAYQVCTHLKFVKALKFIQEKFFSSNSADKFLEEHELSSKKRKYNSNFFELELEFDITKVNF